MEDERYPKPGDLLGSAIVGGKRCRSGQCIPYGKEQDLLGLCGSAILGPQEEEG